MLVTSALLAAGTSTLTSDPTTRGGRNAFMRHTGLRAGMRNARNVYDRGMFDLIAWRHVKLYW